MDSFYLGVQPKSMLQDEDLVSAESILNWAHGIDDDERTTFEHRSTANYLAMCVMQYREMVNRKPDHTECNKHLQKLQRLRVQDLKKINHLTEQVHALRRETEHYRASRTRPEPIRGMPTPKRDPNGG